MYRVSPGLMFGDLTLIQKVKSHNKSSQFWLCRCKCGKECEVSLAHLRSGHTASCGCRRTEADKKRAIHNGKKLYPREYKSWKEMRSRCMGKPDHAKWYADKGITVCKRWDDFRLFLTDMGLRPTGTSIHRIDGNKGYDPGNCKWATPKEQATNNTGCFHKLTS